MNTASRTHATNRKVSFRLIGANLIAGFGLAFLIGCETGPSHSGLTMGESSGSVRHTQSYIQSTAKSKQLPEQYVSEARIGLADVEQKLAAARATEVEREAALREGTARIQAQRQDALMREQIAVAEADKLKQQYDAQQSKIYADVAARQRDIKAAAERDVAIVNALAKERMTLQEQVISQAERDMAEAAARIEKLRTVRQTTEAESLAAIQDMRENARATRARAMATVDAIRAEAASISDQTAARAEELTITIDTVVKHSAAESKRLAAKASALEQDAKAQAAELQARADALTTQASQEEYDVKIRSADSTWQQAQFTHEHQFAEAQANYEKAQAQIQRSRADAELVSTTAQTDFKKGIDELGAWMKDAKAEIEKIRIKADRAELVSRAEFVKAEAEARAEALKETAAHSQAVAEEEMKAIIAEAEAEATRLRALILDELAARQQAGSVELTGKTGPAQTLPENLHDVPNAPTVTPVVARVEPERIAAFRGSLAAVMRDRAIADAQIIATEASHAETQSKLEAVKSQKLAIAAEQLAIAGAIGAQASAKLAELQAGAEAQLALAKSGYDRAVAEAGAFRKEALAQAADIRSGAKALQDVSIAKASQMRAESDMIARNGQAEAQSLRAQLKALQQRGTAEHSRLLAEADTIEQSEAALATQVDAQIAAAEKTLRAELVKLDRSIEAQGIVANANYEESLVRADVVAKQAEVEIARIRAKNELDQSLAAADIAVARNNIYMNKLKGEADVERMIASARASTEQAVAVTDAEMAHIRAQSDIADAVVVANRRTATAQEEAVKSLFDARVVQADSIRTMSFAQAYRDDSFRRKNLETALSQAEAARAESQQRLASLREQQKELETAALLDWDQRLATLRRWSMNTTVDLSVPAPTATPATTGRETITTTDKSQQLRITEVLSSEESK